MKNTFNPKPESIKLTKEEITELWQYLCKCDVEAFSGVNNYSKHMIEREYLYKWHLKEIAYKVFTKLFSVLVNDEKKYFSFKINEVERRTLSVMFQRVDCSPFMLTVQSKFIHKLEKL